MIFHDTQERKPINRAGLVSIYERLFGDKCNNLNKDEIEAQIKRFGRCECSKSCKRPLAGQCDFDHKYPRAVGREGDIIHWQALHPLHHRNFKTKDDVRHIAKIKRTAKKYNPEYIQEPIHKPYKKKWASRPMQSKNTPRFSNTRVDD